MSAKSFLPKKQQASGKLMAGIKKAVLTVILLSINNVTVWAQTDTETMQGMDADSMQGMDHDTMTGVDHGAMQGSDHDSTVPQSKKAGQDTNPADSAPAMAPMNHDSMPGMDHSTMQGMDHGTVQGQAQGSMPGMDHGTTMPMNGSNMDSMNMEHGSMQGGTVPAEARDPNAYSGGYTLESGPYALSGPRQLRMADEHNFGSLLVDRLEAVRTSDNTSAAYDILAWYGRDFDRAVLKAEGHYDNSKLEEASTELYWGHAISAYWNSELGLRYDSGEGPNRTWLAFGVQGLAPYWFETSITGYIGKDGRSAINIETEYEILFTQKLILQPRIEADIYGKDDTERSIGSGLSQVTAGLRLRYEFRREFAPYVGVEWAGMFGKTADFARAAGMDSRETRAVAGIRFWF